MPKHALNSAALIPGTGMDVDTAISLVRAELDRAQAKFAAFHSGHEGYAVMREELEELWDEIKRNDPHRATVEAVQVAAMALRYLVDLGVFPNPNGRPVG